MAERQLYSCRNFSAAIAFLSARMCIPGEAGCGEHTGAVAVDAVHQRERKKEKDLQHAASAGCALDKSPWVPPRPALHRVWT